ncbi:hypothetical protein [Helicobacter macacae]|nr:hypothetical protein [Helicobacter macacae]
MLKAQAQKRVQDCKQTQARANAKTNTGQAQANASKYRQER